MDLAIFLRILLRRKWLIISFSLLTAITTFLLLTFKKDLFESVAQYSTGFTSEKVRLTDGTPTIDLYTADSKFNNVIATFKSPRVIGMLSYKLLLHDLQNPENPYRKLTAEDKKKDAYKNIVKKDTIITILKDLVKNSKLLSPSDKTEKKILEYLKLFEYDYYSFKESLIIKRVERTDYLDIVFQSENPELSAYVVNTLGTEFVNYYSKLNEQRNTASAENIKDLLNRQQHKVDSLTNELKLAKVIQGALDPVEQSKSAMETVRELQIQLSKVQSEHNLQSSLFDTYNERIKTLTLLLDNKNGIDLASLFKERDELREQIAKSPNPESSKRLNTIDQLVKQQSSSGQDKVKNQAEISDLQNRSREAKASIEASTITISQLNRLISGAKNIGNVSPTSQVEIGSIDRQLEIENNELKTLREKFLQAEGLIRDDPAANLRQTLIGEPDIEPVPKRRILTTGLAAISMFFIISILILLIELFDNSIKTPSQLKKSTKLEVISFHNKLSIKKISIENIFFQGNSENKFEVIFLNSIRKLRFEIEKIDKKVFLLTSTQKKTGKSVIAESLAYSFLVGFKKVLLIDLNFENNTISINFENQNLIDEILNSINDVDIIQNLSASKIENLYVVSCYQSSKTPEEAFSMDKLSLFLKLSRNFFDIIIIESAAMNLRSDSFELFSLADGIIPVFSANKTLTATDYRSIESIKKAAEKNKGAILNMIEFENINL